MPVTKLDKSVALVVIDLQKGIIAAAASVADQVITQTARLAREFRKRRLPVVLSLSMRWPIAFPKPTRTVSRKSFHGSANRHDRQHSEPSVAGVAAW